MYIKLTNLKTPLSFLLLCFFVFALPKIIYPFSDTLIDFTKYEEENKKLLPTGAAIEKEEALREKFYNKPHLLKDEKYFFFGFGKPIPRFSITANDMLLSKWLINYKPNNPKRPIPQRTLYSLKNINKNIPKYIKGSLYAHMHFPYKSEIAVIKPPFKLYPYSKEGHIININNGVLYNVNKIQSISLRLGITNSNFKGISVHLWLKNHKGLITSYPLGFIFDTKNKKTRYFAKYDNKAFQNEITKAKALKSNLYYKVYYTNNKIHSFAILKNRDIIYREINLEWQNAHYIKKREKTYKKIAAYPKEIPFVVLNRIILKKQSTNKIKNFQVFFKDITVYYNKNIHDSVAKLYKHDDKIWNIRSKKNRMKRQKVEAENAQILLKKFKRASEVGFLQYLDFKNYFDAIP